MRVVFMGTPDFAVGTLERIIADGHQIVAVVTQPDKPKGRGKELAMPPVKAVAVKHNIKVYQPVKLRNSDVIEELREIAPDVIVVVAFGQLLPQSVLDIPKYGCINVHASLLPAYRGAAPIQWAVIDGLEKTGVTTMLMNSGLDTGDILMQRELFLDKKETGGSLFDRLCVLGAELLSETLAQLEKGTLTPVKQNEELASYARLLKKEMGSLDFDKPAVELERLIRGLNPWPSAYTRLGGKQLKIWDSEAVETLSEPCMDNHTAVPATDNGTVVCVQKDSFTVKCGSGFLKVLDVQMEGKKRMPADAFLRGVKVECGMKLGM